MSWVVLDHELVPSTEARLPASDRGFLYGEGLLETIQVTTVPPPLLDRHHTRMSRSAAALGLPAPPPTEQWWWDMLKLMFEVGDPDLLEEERREQRTTAIVRVTWSAGSGGGPFDAPQGPPTFLLTRRPLTVHEHPVALGPVTFRPGRHACHKTLARWPYLRARAEAVAAGFYDALLIDEAGMLLEASCANVFLRSRGELVTPPADGRILPGIAREEIIERTGAIERPISLVEALDADAAWITSAAHPSVAVSRIGDVSLDVFGPP